MSWKQILLIILTIDLLVLGVLGYVFSGMDIDSEPGEFAGISSVWPVGLREDVSGGGWVGERFAGRFRLLHRSDGTDVDLSKMITNGIPKPWLQRRISLGTEGWHLIRKRPKGYILYAVFRTGETVYWCDFVSNSTLDHGKRFFNKFLINLRISGIGVNDRLPGELAEIDRTIPVWFIQSTVQLLGFMAVIFLFSFLVMYLVMHLSGACPREVQGKTLLCSPQVTVKISKMGTNTSPCCLCLEGGKIVAYRFRKPFLTISLKEEKTALVFENNCIIYQNYTFRLPPDLFQQWRMMIG